MGKNFMKVFFFSYFIDGALNIICLRLSKRINLLQTYAKFKPKQNHRNAGITKNKKFHKVRHHNYLC